MIPAEITRRHIKLAASEISRNGVAYRRDATKYLAVIDGVSYPPKYLVSVAAKFAIGRELLPNEFSGGPEANEFLSELGITIREKHDWTWDECYLAVYAYDQIDIDRDAAKVGLYKQVADVIGRSAKAVEWKVQNVSSCDPRPRSERPISAASNKQRLLGDVFSWYWRDRATARTHLEAVLARLDIADGQQLGAPGDLNILIEEGADHSRIAVRKKRSQQLIELGRAHYRALDPDGCLRCSACGFTTPQGYDREIVHLHHKEPIADIGPHGRTLKLERALSLLTPLCPTCHALAHLGSPPLSVEAVKQLRLST